MRFILASACALILSACAPKAPSPEATSSTPNNYHASFEDVGKATGGVKLLNIKTSKGDFKVWTKRVGNNPTIKVLLLHGGPGMTHEYFEVMDSYFPNQNIEYYYYDQLGSHYSEAPDHDELVSLDRYVDEVEQVRVALNLDKSNLFILGHSWGGLLAMEYALKHQDKLKGLIISNMMSSTSSYNKYAQDVIMPSLDQTMLKEVQALEAAKKYDDPRYMELLIPHHYEKHFLRMPYAQWPDPVQRAMKHLNPKIYIPMQGPSELGASGKLMDWNRTNDLAKISVPTLIIGAKHDTMDPVHMEMMSKQVQNGRFLLCENGSHMSMYDDQKTYFDGVIKFIKDVDNKQFPPSK